MTMVVTPGHDSFLTPFSNVMIESGGAVTTMDNVPTAPEKFTVAVAGDAPQAARTSPPTAPAIADLTPNWNASSEWAGAGRLGDAPKGSRGSPRRLKVVGAARVRLSAGAHTTACSSARRRAPHVDACGAGDETRTRDLLLGKQMLYQLRYSRSRQAVESIASVAGRLGYPAGA